MLHDDVMDRQVACFTVPAFEIALARLSDPALRGRPVGIAPLHAPHALLHELSVEAEAAGLRAGMSIEDAIRLCPSLRLLPPNRSRVRQTDDALHRTIARYAPVWEPHRPGTIVMDFTGTTRLFGSTCNAAAKLQREIAHHHSLDGTVGIGSNKLVAQTASSLIQPSQLYDVRHGSERDFMAPVPICSLPLLHRPSLRPMLRQLDDLNLQTFGDLAELPTQPLELVFGKWALLLWRWAHGIDSTPVLPPPHQPHVEVALTLDSDDIDDRILLGHALNLLERLCSILRRRQCICRCLSLTIRYSDHQEATHRQAVEPASQWEADLRPSLDTLFRRCFRRRIRVRRITLAANELAAPAEQLQLFDDESHQTLSLRHRTQRLAVALDTLRERFGPHAVRYGRTS